MNEGMRFFKKIVTQYNRKNFRFSSPRTRAVQRESYASMSVLSMKLERFFLRSSINWSSIILFLSIKFDVLSSKVQNWTVDRLLYCLEYHVSRMPVCTRRAVSIRLRFFFSLITPFLARCNLKIEFLYGTNKHFSSSEERVIPGESYSILNIVSIKLSKLDQ